jgi:hypothetical protein
MALILAYVPRSLWIGAIFRFVSNFLSALKGLGLGNTRKPIFALGFSLYSDFYFYYYYLKKK